MPFGRGKYDAIATFVQEATDAEGAVVLVIEGVKGTGFSVNGTSEMIATLPALLRGLAAHIEGEVSSGNGDGGATRH
jgi:hypothetical protein